MRFIAGQNYKGTVVIHPRLERPQWVLERSFATAH